MFKCRYFLYDLTNQVIYYNQFISGFEATILVQTVRKYLVYGYVPILEKTFRSGTRESCVAQRSIYVMLRGNEETRSYINRVSNVLRHLLFCYRICVRCNKRPTISFILIPLTFLRICSNDRKIGHLSIKELIVDKYLCSEIWSLCTNSCDSIRWEEIRIAYIKFRICCYVWFKS